MKEVISAVLEVKVVCVENEVGRRGQVSTSVGVPPPIPGKQVPERVYINDK